MTVYGTVIGEILFESDAYRLETPLHERESLIEWLYEYGLDLDQLGEEWRMLIERLRQEVYSDKFLIVDIRLSTLRQRVLITQGVFFRLANLYWSLLKIGPVSQRLVANRPVIGLALPVSVAAAAPAIDALLIFTRVLYDHRITMTTSPRRRSPAMLVSGGPASAEVMRTVVIGWLGYRRSRPCANIEPTHSCRGLLNFVRCAIVI